MALRHQRLNPPGEPIPPTPTATAQPQPQPPRQTKLRSLLHQADRAAIIAALQQAHLHHDAHKMSLCREAYTVALCRHCNRTKTLQYHCDHPLCPDCAAWRSAKRAAALRGWIKSTWRPKHVVLTQPHSDQPLRAQLQQVKLALSRLRRTKWARHWVGGTWRVEITHGDHGWHVHLHLIVDAGWIDHRELSRRWAAATRNPTAVVWIKDLRTQDAAVEVTKYTIKPQTIHTVPPDRLLELLLAIRKNRLFGTWGTARPPKAPADPEAPEPEPQGLVCECGASDWEFFSDAEWEAWTAIHGIPEPTPIPPPPPP